MLFTLVCEIALVTHCVRSRSTREPRLVPKYHNIDARAMPLVIDYVKFAQRRGIRFTKPLTIGFTDINDGGTVGTCWMGKKFREIDIDIHEWDTHTIENREELLFHELTHCLCNRYHDYGSGDSYTPIILEPIEKWFHNRPFYMSLPGRYPDGCPTSIMFPRVLAKSCIQEHRDEYFNEMFNHCKPW